MAVHRLKRSILAVLAGLAILLACGPALAAGSAAAPLMTIDELKARLGEADLVILDVRTPSDFQESDLMVAGAARRAPRQVAEWSRDYADHKDDRTFVLYCA